MSHLRPLPGRITKLEREFEKLKARLGAILTGDGRLRQDANAPLGVIHTHTHRGTGAGGTLDFKGTGSIASGATSATVTHGCGFTPTLQQITVTLGENPTNDPGIIWVDTIGATTFQVNCRSDPGASNLDFGWRVSPT